MNYYNLLNYFHQAKLKAHIHDPNAPELVHFLFTPLSLIYEASRDPYHGNQNLADQAVAPVVTGEAKALLLNCLTSKEIELWQQLGKHWTTSRWEDHLSVVCFFLSFLFRHQSNVYKYHICWCIVFIFKKKNWLCCNKYTFL